MPKVKATFHTYFRLFVFTSLCGALVASSCKVEEAAVAPGGSATTDEGGNPRKYKTEHVFILVSDGPRYSETWGDPTHRLIPKCEKLFTKEGCVFTSFWNKGPTYTTAGHTALITGHYQVMDGFGFAAPERPTLFHYWLSQHQKPAEKAWIVASKDKLATMAKTTDAKWKDEPTALTNCGFGGYGLGSGYRSDLTTYQVLIGILEEHKPSLVLINLLAPDYFGHMSDWERYQAGIKLNDEQIDSFWKYLQSDSTYKDKTTLFVTNDHGRHLDGHLDGFVSHGDTCLGCEHINLFAIGPDFKKNYVCDNHFEQIDIAATAAELMGIKMEQCDGKIIREIFTE